MVSPVGQPDLWRATHIIVQSVLHAPHTAEGDERVAGATLSELAGWTHAPRARKNSSISPSRCCNWVFWFTSQARKNSHRLRDYPPLASKTWRAYLSTSTENARDRIGTGPWRNAAGVIIANNVAELHDQAAGGASEANYPLNNINTPLREDGTPLPAQPVLHDIITGSNLDGTVSASGTCSDWTATTGTTRNGHSNRAGGGQNPSSWNSAHDTGCAEPAAGANFAQGTVSQGGGLGAIYCFATN